MARIEKTVFISYRRTDVYTALAVYENLKNQGYDVFFDYRSISSGDFEQIITSNIKARAHFLLILTPTALDRCNEPGDWLRREIEIAINEKRNIVPLFFKGFRFGDPSVSEKLTGKLKDLSRYNGLNVHEDYFDEAMQRLRTQFLNIPLDTILHPVSTEVQKVVRAEQVAADRALEQIEDVKELAKQFGEKPSQPQPVPALDPKEAELERLESMAIQHELRGKFWDALQIYYQIRKLDPLYPGVDVKIRELEKEVQPKPVPVMVSQAPVIKPTRNAPVSFRLVAIGIAALLVIILCIWGGVNIWNNLASATSEPTRTSQPAATLTLQPAKTNTPSPTQPSILPTHTLGIGSTMTGKDGMTLLYIPEGKFTMGSETGANSEKPVRQINIGSFWIDQTEVTNAMYAMCIQDGKCNQPQDTTYISDPKYADHPVVYVFWNDAIAYCSWADRRLPTEAEWEKAASWNELTEKKSVYPWSDEFNCHKGNFDDEIQADTDTVPGGNNCDGFSQTSPVGIFMDGRSSYGVMDMAGNVWEWVSSLYKPYPYIGTDGREDLSVSGDRVLRGGSWAPDVFWVRSTSRNAGIQSATVDSDIGFRCVMDVTP